MTNRFSISGAERYSLSAAWWDIEKEWGVGSGGGGHVPKGTHHQPFVGEGHLAGRWSVEGKVGQEAEMGTSPKPIRGKSPSL